MRMVRNIKINIFWWFTILIALLLLIPSIIPKGMFLDGITYATISRNLANGLGTLTKPFYTETIAPIFYEHPPLVFWLQSIFFTFFGDSVYVEKLYSIATGMFTGWGLLLLWRGFAKDNDKKFNWIPILLWITTPIVFWAYPNNVLENTLGIFTIFSVL